MLSSGGPAGGGEVAIVKEVLAESVLSKSKVYGHVVNPCIGWQRGCTYRCARLVKRVMGRREPWGEFVDVTTDAAGPWFETAGFFHYCSVMDRISPSEREWYVEVRGGEIFVKSWTPPDVSDQTPLFLLHDSLGCVDLWRDFPRLLSAGLSRIVVAYDRLGFGRSSERMDPLPLDFIVEEADEFFPAVLRSVGGKRYDLFGHSVGGGMAVAVAVKVPGCRSVVTESAQALVEPRTTGGIAKAKEEFSDPVNFGRLARYHGPKARWVLNSWTDTWLSPAFAGWSLAHLLGQVRCPVLAIHGDRDEYGSIASPEMIRKYAGGRAEMVIIPDCGHLPHREKPQAVLGILRDFYRDRVDEGRHGG